jgi:hypothetical protein
MHVLIMNDTKSGDAHIARELYSLTMVRTDVPVQRGVAAAGVRRARRAPAERADCLSIDSIA